MFNVNHAAIRRASPLIIAAFVGLAAASCGASPQTRSAGHDIPAPPQAPWPKASEQKGQYFSYMEPDGWKASETTNGVDLASADGTEAIGFVGLEGTPGSSSPRDFMNKITGALKFRNVTFTEQRRRPSQHGFATTEFLIRFADSKGRDCEGWAWCAANNSFGRNNCYADVAWATAPLWRLNSQFLVAMARMVTVINPQQAFQRDQLQRMNVAVGPGSAGGYNHPNTFTPHSRQAAMDRISDIGAHARRDDHPLVDPSTGTTYHGTSANYDQVRGGWVNPRDPTQLLTEVPPGK